METINTWIEQHRTEMVRELMQLIEIPSVYDTPRPDAPFGPGVKKALEAVLQLAERLGFETRNLDGYAGEITAWGPDPGDRPPQDTRPFLVGILCHVDVVAGGGGWETDPFAAVLREDRIYGRGAMDDKGPLISCLYAMRQLQESGRIPAGSALRLIVGTNEEEDWNGIRYYLKRTPFLPDLSIVPDAGFPLIFCEKGLLDFDLTLPADVGLGDADRRAEDPPARDLKKEAPVRLLALAGGSGRNVVPGKCSCTLALNTAAGAPDDRESAETFLRRLAGRFPELTVERRGRDAEGRLLLEIIASGKSTHCMSPEKGRNAISLLMAFLHGSGDVFSHSAWADWYERVIGDDYYGGRFGIACEDDLSGRLTFNIGTICFANGALKMQANIRYPASLPYEDILQSVRAAANRSAAQFEFKDHLPAICFEPDSPFIRTLMQAYREETGDRRSRPEAIGGATYARAIPHAVACGPLFPDEEELAHEPNEFLRISSLMKMTAVYIRALALLLENRPATR